MKTNFQIIKSQSVKNCFLQYFLNFGNFQFFSGYCIAKNGKKDVKMKLRLILFVIIISTQASCAQSNNKTLIKDFINEIVLTGNTNQINSYLTIKDDFINNENNLLFMKAIIELLKSELDNNNCENYEIMAFKEVNKPKLSNLERYLEEYQKYENTFFVVCNSTIVIPFILKDNKIVSFSTTLSKSTKRDYYPMFLDR